MIILNYNQIREIYDYLTDLLQTEILKNTNLFFVVIIVISCISFILLVLSLLLKWKHYVAKIKLEEYMSNKLIAEIPIYIIKKNKGICKHLSDFSNKNS